MLSRTGVHPLGNWSLSTKGYPRFHSGPLRGRYVHRVVWEQIAGRLLPDRWHVHHQDFCKTNFDGLNLIACPPEFNPASQLRDPYTGQYLSAAQWERRYAA